MISQKSGVSSPAAGQAGSVYNQADKAATPQSGSINEFIVLKQNGTNGPGLVFPSSVYTNPISGKVSYPGNIHSAYWQSVGTTIQSQKF